MPDIDADRAALKAALAELDALDKATDESRAPVTLDQQSVGRLSRMDAMQVQAMAQATKQRRMQERQRIEAALERLDSGDYGFCVRCGTAIAPERLKVDPAAPFCRSCVGARD